MSGDAVQEPAVVADYQHGPGEVFQGVFQGAHGIHVQVVGRFVEQEHIGTGFEHQSEVHAIALAAGEHLHLFLLVRAGNVEARAVGPGVDFLVAEPDAVVAFADDFVHAFAGGEGFAALVHPGQLDRIAHAQASGIGLFRTRDHPEERGFARAVGADDAYNGSGRNDEVHVVHKKLVAHGFLRVFRFGHDLAKARSGRDIDFQIRGAAFGFVRKHGFVGVDAGLAFGVTAFGCHADPVKFALQGLLAFGLGLFFIGQAFLLLFQPGGVVALPRDAPAAIQFQNPSGHVVQKVAVVGDRDDRAGKALQVAFQPGHGLGVQMVGGFVQQKNIRVLQQETAQGHAAALPSGDDRNRGVGRGAAQGVHGHVQTGIEIPDVFVIHLFLHLALALDEGVHFLRLHGLGEFGVDGLEFIANGREFGNALFNHFAHAARFIHQRLLLQVADGEAGGEHGFTVKALIHPGQYFQKRTLARAVQAEHADFRAVEVGKRDVLKDFFLPVPLGHANHGIDNLVRFVAHASPLSWEEKVALWNMQVWQKRRCLSREGKGSQGTKRERARSTRPFFLKAAPSARKIRACSSAPPKAMPGAISPSLLMTRWQGSPRSFGAACMA